MVDSAGLSCVVSVTEACQYFYRNGKVIGRALAEAMGFDKAKGGQANPPDAAWPRHA